MKTTSLSSTATIFMLQHHHNLTESSTEQKEIVCKAIIEILIYYEYLRLFQVKTLHTELLHELSTDHTSPPIACSQSSVHIVLPSPPAPPPPHALLGNRTRNTSNTMASGDREMRQEKTFRLQKRHA
jgi:hypothetical protein